MSTNVLWTSFGDFVYFLDVQHGSYSALSGEQAVLWRERHGSVLTRLDTASDLYRVRHFPMPGIILAAWCILRTRLLLRRGRFEAAYRMAEVAASRSHTSRVPLNTSSFDTAMARFLLCESLFGSPDPARDCLGRSLSLFVYLRRLGFPAVHYIGIQSLPFAAHAWVAMNGEPLLDTRERLQKFAHISQID